MNNDTMRQAMRLMQAGDLQAATRTLQHRLTGGVGRGSTDTAPAAAGRTGAGPDDCIEGEFRIVDDGRATDAPQAGPAPRPTPAPRPGAPRPPARGRRRFSCEAGELDYRLHVPDGLDTRGAPLLVMLHGCTQTPEDFARGTRMDVLAGAQGYVVAWPAQSSARNPNRCWNWFRGSDQQRDSGEPAILAALTRALVATRGLDAGRVYVAGLSAGGAMAAVLADTHPELYAAIGVHSGLPTGLASDMPSAFAAMRKGGAGRRVAAAGTTVPAIVFHGDGDTTVHPDNARGVVEQSLGGRPVAEVRSTSSTREQAAGAGGRSATRTLHRAADGRVLAEHWMIHGAGHAWSGGDAAGTYTDPHGPDASAGMLRFFADCRRAG
ncbi:PHB depolymerase family esterase [Luteimonas sp. MC1895]|uniref:extracellular catalytic domain type 1 short-chain-length polyhydroxyalkanoate depolymerase n=1 Tax=Luteimonas sp. MC1895 TaxID=2819513 RepID=UPI0018F0DA1B|nr:PHB depolymerase family esterase [Luteimonas sp. MC1895]MBJ6979411.1 PHB depolymerase family esterase [Luteimonas sp. MC1895]